MAVSNDVASRRESRHPRFPRRALAALAGLAAAVSLPAGAAASATPTTPAAAAIRALDTPGATAAVPDDFRAVAGYRPALLDGLLIAPHGSCSSPVPLPAEFETACKAHDLGYDLLRYADRTGSPLGPWARRELDSALAGRMRAACARRTAPLSRLRCEVMAEVAAIAVDLNSRRQHYGVPVVEHFSLAGLTTTWPARTAALLLVVYTVLLPARAAAPSPYAPHRIGRLPALHPATVAAGGSHD
ncbi:hypothetical protein [Nocardia sp. X0981]